MGVRNTTGFYDMNCVATFTKTIPILIWFLQQPNIIKYINKVSPIMMARGHFPIMIPTTVKIAKIDSERTIIV